MAHLILLHMAPLILLIRKTHAPHATVPLMASLILHYCHTWRHSCCIAAKQSTFMMPHMAPLMLLHMKPLMQLMLLLRKAHATHAASHGAVHTALLPPRRHPCCHTWRHSGYDTTHGATHMPHMASLMLHCCHIGASHATTHGATHMPHMASLMLHCCNIGATHAATWILSV